MFEAFSFGNVCIVHELFDEFHSFMNLFGFVAFVVRHLVGSLTVSVVFLKVLFVSGDFVHMCYLLVLFESRLVRHLIEHLLHFLDFLDEFFSLGEWFGSFGLFFGFLGLFYLIHKVIIDKFIFVG